MHVTQSSTMFSNFPVQSCSHDAAVPAIIVYSAKYIHVFFYEFRLIHQDICVASSQMLSGIQA